MTICFGKSCLLCMFFVNFLNGFEGRMVLIARIPDRWLSVYFTSEIK